MQSLKLIHQMGRIKLTILLSILMTSSYSQQVEWKSISNQRSESNQINLNDAGQIVQARIGMQNNTVGVYTQNGELICENQICDCDANNVITSASVSSGRVLYLTNDGELFLSNNICTNSELIIKIIPDSLQEITFRFQNAELINDKLLTIGDGIIDGTRAQIHASINLQTFEVEREIIFSDLRLTSFSYNINNDASVEIYSNSIASKTEKILINDQLGEVLCVQLNSNSERFQYGYFTDSEHVIVVGAKEKMSQLYGIARAYDLEGNIIWNLEFEPDEGENLLVLQRIEQKDGKLILGGISGANLFDYDALTLSIDEEKGEVIWKLREHIQGEGDDVSDILILDDGDIIVSGTSGLSDVGGSQRAYLMKIKDRPSSLNFPIAKTNIFYPNPANNRLFFLDGCEVKHVEILTMEGKTIISDYQNKTLDVSHLIPGIYVIRINVKDKFHIQKFIIANK